MQHEILKPNLKRRLAALGQTQKWQLHKTADKRKSIWKHISKARPKGSTGDELQTRTKQPGG